MKKNRSKLVIAFDAKRAASNRTGLGNYSRYILDGLTQEPSRGGVILCTPKPSKMVEYEELLGRQSVSQIIPKCSLAKSIWRSWGVVRDMKKHHVSVFHGLSNEIPFGLSKCSIKSVVTIHDLIFRRFPHFYHPIDRTIYNLKFRYACRNADRIIAISECTKRDIIHYYGIDSKKIEVIYQGCSPRFSEVLDGDQLAQIRRKYALPNSFLLSVGSIEERKNANLIVRALPLIFDDIPLVLIGKRTPYTLLVERTARQLNLENRVIIIENLPFSDLPAIYRLAKIFIYPSRYEGFGIPIVEALTSSVPVIAATGSCLEEAGGVYSLYTNPDDPQQLASLINQVLVDPELQNRMISKGEEHAQRFNLARSTQELMRVYEQLG